MGSGLAARKQSGQRFFSPQLILQFTEGSNGFITEKTRLFQGSRGGPTFSVGGGGGGGGKVQMLNSIKTHITCDFRGGGGGGGRGSKPPIPPLDPHMVLVHVHPRKLVFQGTRLLSTVLVQPRIRLLYKYWYIAS